MSEQPNSNQSGTSTLEKIAIAVSAAIVLSGIIYWIIQIQGAREMLQQAYPDG